MSKLHDAILELRNKSKLSNLKISITPPKHYITYTWWAIQIGCTCELCGSHYGLFHLKVWLGECKKFCTSYPPRIEFCQSLRIYQPGYPWKSISTCWQTYISPPPPSHPRNWIYLGSHRPPPPPPPQWNLFQHQFLAIPILLNVIALHIKGKQVSAGCCEVYSAG